jgi:hypothetical protein
MPKMASIKPIRGCVMAVKGTQARLVGWVMVGMKVCQKMVWMLERE